MTKEELLALGLTEEQIKDVFVINGKDVEKAKGDLATKETELTSAKEQLIFTYFKSVPYIPSPTVTLIFFNFNILLPFFTTTSFLLLARS